MNAAIAPPQCREHDAALSPSTVVTDSRRRSHSQEESTSKSLSAFVRLICKRFFIHLFMFSACLTAAAPWPTFWVANSRDSAGNTSRMTVGPLIGIQTQFGAAGAANVRHLRCSNMQRNIWGIVTLVLLHSPFFPGRVVPFISAAQLMNRAHLTPCLVSESAEKWQHCMTRSATAGITLFTAT